MVSLQRLRRALYCLLFLLVFSGTADAETVTYDAKNVTRAEKILSKLTLLDLASDTKDFSAFKATVTKLYPALFVEVADLRESDLKTELTTAVFLYETLYRTWNTTGAQLADCGDELRMTYQQLCRGGEEPTRKNFIRSKARLHSNWAAAIARSGRGVRDAKTDVALSELRTAREVDLELALRAHSLLTTLGTKVRTYSSLHEFDESGKVAHVSFAEFSAELSLALAQIDKIISQLPRGSLHGTLRNARNAFRQGAFWWSKSNRAEQKTISVNSLAESDSLNGLGRQASAVNYTVVSDWRKALRAIDEAGELIGGQRDKLAANRLR